MEQIAEISYRAANPLVNFQALFKTMSLLTRCQLICVEGNISAGKSTLCKELAERLDYELFLEPVLTNPYIERYYADVSEAAPTRLCARGKSCERLRGGVWCTHGLR